MFIRSKFFSWNTLAFKSIHEVVVHMKDSDSFKQKAATLSHWFRSPLGCVILEYEQRLAANWLRHCYGYHACQLGCLEQASWLSSCMIPHQIGVAPVVVVSPFSILQSTWDNLPLQNESIDLICLPHTLDFSVHGQAIIAEAERVLIPNGKLILFGFNRYSLLRYWHFLSLGNSNIPPISKWGSKRSVARLLNDMQFDLLKADHGCVKFPIKNEKWLSKCQGVEMIFEKMMPGLGAIYACFAEKRVSTIIPIKPKWQRSKNVVSEHSVTETSRQGVEPLD